MWCQFFRNGRFEQSTKVQVICDSLKMRAAEVLVLLFCVSFAADTVRVENGEVWGESASWGRIFRSIPYAGSL